MAYTTINKSSDYFNTKLYTGNGSAGHAITGVGFQPDFVWIKERNGTNNHEINDAVRGANYQIYPNLTNAQTNAGGHLTAFASDGFTLGTDGSINTNTNTYVSWNWKANGSGSSNSDATGSYPITSTVSANTTAGFSIVKYTGNGYSTATIGHGLGSKPAMVIMRPLGYSGAWWIVHKDLTADNVLEFNTNAQANISSFGGGGLKYSTFTTSVIGGGNGSSDSGLWNGSGQDYIAYCFAEKTGYSKFGSYTGNGNADGTFVYTGFKPAFVILKTSNLTGGWYIKDSIRSGGTNPNGSNPNETDNPTANTSNAENKASAFGMDILSNGFKLRATDGYVNFDGGNYIYMAFAEAPLVGTNGVTAKAR